MADTLLHVKKVVNFNKYHKSVSEKIALPLIGFCDTYNGGRQAI